MSSTRARRASSREPSNKATVALVLLACPMVLKAFKTASNPHTVRLLTRRCATPVTSVTCRLTGRADGGSANPGLKRGRPGSVQPLQMAAAENDSGSLEGRVNDGYTDKRKGSAGEPFFKAPINGDGGTDGDSDKVTSIELNNELQTSFMQYAMSIILGRALPDVRDGLKPVHRRILYAMHGLGLQPDAGYRKCARVVGEVLGKYHPHGDMAVYDALVRMAQDFVMGAPLISGHGNFGSVDADPAAAMRYTECKLSSVARDSLLLDIGLDTVDFIPNFDGNEKEPVVLPARLPLLLLNGATGIAVGMATNVPPHNLGELVSATVAMIRNPNIADEELLRLIPAPDFPTGGRIMGLGGARKMYTTSNGGIPMRAATHLEVISNRGRPDRNAIVVTELPYQVCKSALLERMAAMVNEKKLEGIADLRDESDRDGIRMVIELKRDAMPKVVLNNLFKKTQLQTSFSGNMLALGKDGKQPERFTLRSALKAFIAFRFDTLRRRTSHELAKVAERDHVVRGMLVALERIDDVIDIVRKSKDTAEARAALMGDDYGLSQAQADAILGLRLGRLTSMEEGKLKEEHEALLKQIAYFEEVMKNDARVNEVMIQELQDIKKKHAVPRRTVILPEEGELSDQDLLANERSVVVLTAAGYIKRMPVAEFGAQNRGGRGKAGAKLGDDDDAVQHFLTCQDHDSLLLVTSAGVAHSVKAFQVPIGSRIARGAPLAQVIGVSSEESISAIIPVSHFTDDECLVLLTKNGLIKRTPLAAFSNVNARGLIIISLADGDELRFVKRCSKEDSLIIGTEHGFATRIKADDVPATGRTSKGCRAMRLREEDHPVDMDVLPGLEGESLPEGKFLAVVTSKGFGKRVDSNQFPVQKRGGMGRVLMKFKKSVKDDSVAALRVVAEGDEIMLSTLKGTIVRVSASMISGQSRSATGVAVQRVDEGDFITSVSLVPEAPDAPTPMQQSRVKMGATQPELATA